jgi:hypothetical protein
MSTTNHVRVSNIPLFDSTSIYIRGFWELTRAMKKAGWKVKASSNGSLKDTTGDPQQDRWNATGIVTNAGAAAASIATPTRGRATVTGLTGIVASDKGRFLSITGGASAVNNHWHQIEEVLSSTSVRIDARQFAVAADANNGALTWSILDPTAEGVSGWIGISPACWWCAQGPSILRVPFTSGSSGTFKRGENLVQTTTGAEGELVGYTYYNGTGWLVVVPRLRGSITPNTAHGWETGNLITGGVSGATVTQVGVATEFFSEVVIAKPAGLQNTVQIFAQIATTGLFSSLASSAGCTATVLPGGGGTGNTFPSVGAWVTWGTGTLPSQGVDISAHSFLGDALANAHVICVDAIPEQGYSADGSWTLVHFKHEFVNVSFDASRPINSIAMYGFHRLNDTEDGDVSLYSSVSPGGSKSLTVDSATSAGGAVSSFSTALNQGSYYAAATTDLTTYVKYAGFTYTSSSNSFAARNFTITSLFATQTTVQLQNTRQHYYSRVQSSANPNMRAREKVWLTGGSARVYKGSFKWLYWVNGGRLGDVFEGDPGWAQLSYGGGVGGGLNSTAMAGGGALVVGPHDGTPWLPNLAGG